MTSENIFELILLAVVAGALIYRLRTVLGTRPDNDAGDPAPKAPPAAENKPQQSFSEEAAPTAATAEASTKDTDIFGKTVEENALMDKVIGIQKRFPNFNITSFLLGAKAAFEMITAAFAKGNLDELKPLVSEHIYSSYSEIIENRKKENQSVEFEIIRFIDAKLKDATLEENKMAKLQVEFTTEQVNAVKDSEGKVIMGSDSFINRVQDLWSFSKDLTSMDPTWKLVATKVG